MSATADARSGVLHLARRCCITRMPNPMRWRLSARWRSCQAIPPTVPTRSNQSALPRLRTTGTSVQPDMRAASRNCAIRSRCCRCSVSTATRHCVTEGWPAGTCGKFSICRAFSSTMRAHSSSGTCARTAAARFAEVGSVRVRMWEVDFEHDAVDADGVPVGRAGLVIDEAAPKVPTEQL